MKIKKFVAPNMPQALHQVRESLGQDAVILSSRKVPERAPDGRRIASVEVTAGLQALPGASGTSAWMPQTEDSVVPARVLAAPAQAFPEAPASTTDPETAARIQELLNRVSREKQGRQLDADGQPGAYSDRQARALPSERPPAESLESKAEVESRQDALLTQLTELKNAVQRLEERSSTEYPLPRELQRLGDRLRQAGVPETLIAQCLKTVCLTLDADCMRSPEIVAATAGQALAELLPPCRDIRINRKKRRIAAFTGTAGAGKTTAVVKIAAGFVKKLRRRAGRQLAEGELEERVVLITTDGQRVGSLHQLEAFARLVGVHLEVAYGEDEMRRALARHEQAELILIDTPALSPGDHEALAAQRGLLAAAHRRALQQRPYGGTDRGNRAAGAQASPAVLEGGLQRPARSHSRSGGAVRRADFVSQRQRQSPGGNQAWKTRCGSWRHRGPIRSKRRRPIIAEAA